MPIPRRVPAVVLAGVLAAAALPWAGGATGFTRGGAAMADDAPSPPVPPPTVPSQSVPSQSVRDWAKGVVAEHAGKGELAGEFPKDHAWLNVLGSVEFKVLEVTKKEE